MAIGPTGTALEEPIPAPQEEPALPASSPGEWIHKNLFNSWYNAVLTVVFVALLGWIAFKAVRFVVVTARWEIIRVNLTNLLLGAFPRGELYRVWIAVFVLTAAVGLTIGITGRRTRGRSGSLGASPESSLKPRRGPWFPAPAPRALRGAVPLLLLVVTLLAFAQTVKPLLLTIVAFAVVGGGWLVGRWLPDGAVRRLPLVWGGAVVGATTTLTAFGGVGWDQWGGLLLTLYLAVGGIVLSFPLGVLLALGRRSQLPAVRAVCVTYIELVRGVPLIAVLFIGAFALGFLLPPTLKPSGVARALIALIAFTAAYLAEVVRGGLQSVPKGQIEAAQAIGLSPLRTTVLVVLPQALRNVIPAIVGQFISLFKDTSLVAIIGIGLTELLRSAQTLNDQPQFLGQGLQAETLVFACFVYWAFCYSMSRASQRLERRLGMGTR
jgi:general L-amino acid transport system permease protein